MGTITYKVSTYLTDKVVHKMKLVSLNHEKKVRSNTQPFESGEGGGGLYHGKEAGSSRMNREAGDYDIHHSFALSFLQHRYK